MFGVARLGSTYYRMWDISLPSLDVFPAITVLKCKKNLLTLILTLTPTLTITITVN